MEYILPAVFTGLAVGFGFTIPRLLRQRHELEQEVQALDYRLALAHEQLADEMDGRNLALMERNLLLSIVQAKAPEHLHYLDAETVEIYPTEADIPQPVVEEEIGVYDDDEDWAYSLGYEGAWPAALAVTDEE